MEFGRFPQKAEFWFLWWFVLKSAQKRNSVAVVSLEKALELNWRTKPFHWIRWPTGRWAALILTLERRKKALRQFWNLALESSIQWWGKSWITMLYFLSLRKLDLEKRQKKWTWKSSFIKFPNNGTFLAYILHGFLFQLKDYAARQKVYGLSVYTWDWAKCSFMLSIRETYFIN